MQIQGRACGECWMLYVSCFGERLCTICGLRARISDSFFQSLLILSEHLIYIYNEYKCALYLNDFPRHMLDTFACAQGTFMCGP